MADADAEHGLSNEPASETFVLEDEDHTLANALRCFLNKKCAPTVVSPAQAFTLRLSDDKLLDSPHVDFCGYSIPHPADPVVNVRIQTTGEISAAEALRQACQSLKAVCSHVKGKFQAAVADRKAEMEVPADADMNDQ